MAESERRIMDNRKYIHLIGICGTAMASLAGMLQARGHRITGSDAAAYPPMSDVLAGLGIPLLQPYAEANLEPRPDLVIVGNAISRGNVELEYVLDTRIPFTSMAAVLHDEFLPGRESLVVAGTHGKTTTTSMLAWIYEVVSRTRAELAPSFLIGGVAENFGTSFMVRPQIEGVKQPFILEGDEYDTAFFDKGPKFLHYFPDARDSDACGVRPCGHISGPGGGEDSVQAAGEPGAAARAGGGVRRKRECDGVRGARRSARWSGTGSGWSRIGGLRGCGMRAAGRDGRCSAEARRLRSCGCRWRANTTR